MAGRVKQLCTIHQTAVATLRGRATTYVSSSMGGVELERWMLAHCVRCPCTLYQSSEGQYCGTGCSLCSLSMHTLPIIQGPITALDATVCELSMPCSQTQSINHEVSLRLRSRNCSLYYCVTTGRVLRAAVHGAAFAMCKALYSNSPPCPI